MKIYRVRRPADLIDKPKRIDDQGLENMGFESDDLDKARQLEPGEKVTAIAGGLDYDIEAVLPATDEIRDRVLDALKTATGEDSALMGKIADYAADFAVDWQEEHPNEDGATVALEQLRSDLAGAIENLKD